ncbi:hypothetical protein NMG60_11037448 [Bertholletia excelsa]
MSKLATKIVIGMQLSTQKDRSKAMKTASSVDGVTSVSTEEGELVVEGEGVDSIKLVTLIRKKVSRHASLVKVEEAEETPASEVFETMESYYYPYNPPPPPPPYIYSSIYDPNPSCSIM